jgi:hypothetical protein
MHTHEMPPTVEMPVYRKVEKFVTEAFEKVENPNEIFHAQRTAHWISYLKPDADEALLIAGVAHDIERAFYGDWKAGSSDADALKKHQEQSATEIEAFLRKESVQEDIIERVKYLVLHHEEGGDEDQNVLCDADSLAYFEEKALRNAKKAKENGHKEVMKKKLEYVMSRITSPKAREKASVWYEDALKVLE